MKYKCRGCVITADSKDVARDLYNKFRPLMEQLKKVFDLKNTKGVGRHIGLVRGEDMLALTDMYETENDTNTSKVIIEAKLSDDWHKSMLDIDLLFNGKSILKKQVYAGVKNFKEGISEHFTDVTDFLSAFAKLGL